MIARKLIKTNLRYYYLENLIGKYGGGGALSVLYNFVNLQASKRASMELKSKDLGDKRSCVKSPV